MPSAPASILVVDHGDLPSLATVMTLAEPARVALWFPRSDDPASARREAAVRTHAALLGRPMLAGDPWRTPAPADGPSPGPASGPMSGLEASLELLQAVVVARRLGCTRVIAPWQAGPDAGAIGRAAERAAVLGDLVEIDGGGVGPALDLPLLDLDDDQVLDLADDAGAPPDAFWPCAHADPTPCGRCAGCVRWARVHDAAGIPWPWSSARTGVAGTAG